VTEGLQAQSRSERDRWTLYKTRNPIPLRFPGRCFDRDPQDAHHPYFEAMRQFQIPFAERLFEFPAVKAVFSGVKEDVFGYEVLIKTGVELFEKIDAAGFQNPGNLAEGGLPFRDVVQDAETEYGLKRCVSIGQIQNIGG